MQYYAAFNLVIMVGAMLKVYAGGPGTSLLWFVLIAEAIALLLGNMIAYGQLRRRYAEIFFVNEHFSLISVYDILYQQEQRAFPLIYANPRLSGDKSQITLHFHDRLVTLKRDDWEDFELIWNWLHPLG